MKKQFIIISLMMLFAVLVLSSVSFAATNEEIKNATTEGTEWLAEQQNADGSWTQYETVGTTSLAVLKLETHATEEGKSPFSPDYQYSGNVSKGLDYIFAHAEIYQIQAGDWPTPTSNPDTNGNGYGVRFHDSGSTHHTNYATGVALAAICANKDPNRVVNVPGSAVNGWTYKQVAQEIVDYLAAVQTNSGNGRGGWYYEAYDYGISDNSISGYVTLGLIYATSPTYNYNCALPSFVKPEMNIWVDYIQNDVDGDAEDGGSGYSNPYSWVNVLKTGSLLEQFAFLGDTEDTQRVKDAIDYLVRHWNDANQDPGWKGYGSGANYQATFNIMKGLESFNIDKIGTDIDWYANFADALIAEQNSDGSWPITTWDYYGILSTAWALLTLEKAAPPAQTADLSITKTIDKSTVFVKDTVIFTLIVQNKGPNTAVEVTVNDKLPEGLMYVNSTANYGSYNKDTGIWTIGNLPNGAVARLTITATVLSSGTIANTARVTSITVDPIIDDNTATVTFNASPETAETVEAASKTVGMLETGIPIYYLILAILIVIGGFLVPIRK